MTKNIGRPTRDRIREMHLRTVRGNARSEFTLLPRPRAHNGILVHLLSRPVDRVWVWAGRTAGDQLNIKTSWRNRHLSPL